MTDFGQVNADWTEVAVTIRAEDTDRAGDIAQMVVPYGIYIEDYSHLEEEAMEIAHIDLIDEELLKKDRTKSVIHVYISPEENPAEAVSFLTERFAAEGIWNEIASANCAEEDWINNWKKYFKPIPVGERLLVRPMWEDEYEAGDRVVPLEVKSGKDYRRHSALDNALKTPNWGIERAVVLHEGNVERELGVDYLPAYMAMFL